MTAAARDDATGDARRALREAGLWDVDGDLDALAGRFLGPHDPETALRRFEAAVAERCARVPLGHVIGEVVFDDLALVVGSGAFVPRAESLGLVDGATTEGMVRHGGLVLDLCAGVGAIGLAVSHRRPDLIVICVERDATAVEYLRRNTARLAAVTGDVRVEVGDLLATDALEHHRDVDLILANPPYVGPDVRLLREWSDHHPRDAVYAGANGLELLRRVAELAARVLRPGGRLILEHDRAQPEQVRDLVVAAGLVNPATSLDPAQEPRITLAHQPLRETP